MSQSQKFKSAFSLIELSIVILIIGILVAGVTQSSRLVSQFRLNSARTQTQSSPVSSIKDLYIWLETTSEKSFDDAETYDASTITYWYDINPQGISKFTLTESTNKPTYVASSINGLPALTFNGTSSKLTSTINFGIVGNSALTIFLVTAISGGNDYGPPLYWGTSGAGTTLLIGRKTSTSIFAGFYGSGHSFTAPSSISNSAVYSWVRQSGGNTQTGNTIYFNGASQTLANEGSPSTPNYGVSTFKVGYSNDPLYFGGRIAEIIIYNRALKNEERTTIEKYLGKKWGIAIS